MHAKYDVVYFTENNQKQARALLKDLPPDQLPRLKNPKLGLRIQDGVPLPDNNGASTGVMGTAFITAAYGTLAFDARHPGQLLMLETLAPGLVAGNFPPSIFDSPAFRDAAAHEKAAEAGAAQSNARVTAAFDAENAEILGAVITGHCAALAQWLSIKPKKITPKRLRAAAANIAEAAGRGNPLAQLLVDHWQATAQPPTPDYDDPLAMARQARAAICRPLEVQNVARPSAPNFIERD